MKNKYFTERERYQLESLLKVGTPVKTIAVMLDKCKATIYNEIKRGSVTFLNSDYTERIEYCADVGQRNAEYNATNKGRQLKIGNDYAFASFVTDCEAANCQRRKLHDRIGSIPFLTAQLI